MNLCRLNTHVIPTLNEETEHWVPKKVPFQSLSPQSYPLSELSKNALVLRFYKWKHRVSLFDDVIYVALWLESSELQNDLHSAPKTLFGGRMVSHLPSGTNNKGIIKIWIPRFHPWKL